MEKREELMDKLKTLAKAQNTIVGRVIRLQRCDGYALYLITKVKGGKATVKWLDWCDGYIDDILEYGCDLSIAKASEFIRRQDALEKLFG